MLNLSIILLLAATTQLAGKRADPLSISTKAECVVEVRGSLIASTRFFSP